jgi:hypothetical protein
MTLIFQKKLFLKNQNPEKLVFFIFLLSIYSRNVYCFRVFHKTKIIDFLTFYQRITLQPIWQIGSGSSKSNFWAFFKFLQKILFIWLILQGLYGLQVKKKNWISGFQELEKLLKKTFITQKHKFSYFLIKTV